MNAKLCPNAFNVLSSCVAERIELEKNSHFSLMGSVGQTIIQVASGLTMTVRFVEGDRRQVLGFHGRNDLVVVDSSENHGHSLEFIALEASFLLRFDTGVLAKAIGKNAAIASALFSDILEALLSQQNAYKRLLCHSAEARVAAFLIEYGSIRCARTSGEQALALPMRRIDIADHLGLRTETLCRVLASWRERELIEVNDPRRIFIKQPYELWCISEERSAPKRPSQRSAKSPIRPLSNPTH